MTEPAGLPTHARVYASLRSMLLFGELQPGRDVTLMGVAEQLGVSITPVREAVRRLIAENALQLHGNRRITVPQMSRARLEELYDMRLMLEPELGMRAADRADTGLAERIEKIDRKLDNAIRDGDISGYLRLNYKFHFEIYDSADSQVLRPIVESLWLQVGPFLRVVCGRYGTASVADHHKSAIAAIKAGDCKALGESLRRDIAQGLKLMRDETVAFEQA